MTRVAAFFDWLNERAGRIAALLLLPAMTVTLVEVVLRYVFNSPTVWASESLQILFGFYFLLGGGYTLLHNGHVRVDVLLISAPHWARRAADVFAMLIAMFYCSVLLWIGGEQALDSIRLLERAESVWAPYIWPVIAAIPVAAALMLLQAFSRIVRSLTATASRGRG